MSMLMFHLYLNWFIFIFPFLQTVRFLVCGFKPTSPSVLRIPYLSFYTNLSLFCFLANAGILDFISLLLIFLRTDLANKKKCLHLRTLTWSWDDLNEVFCFKSKWAQHGSSQSVVQDERLNSYGHAQPKYTITQYTCLKRFTLMILDL